MSMTLTMTHTRSRVAAALAAMALLVVTSGCGRDRAPAAPPADGPHGHTHVAPHGGTLITLGDHVAHVEVVNDRSQGKLNVFVLDGEASGAVRIVQERIVVHLDGLGEDGGSLMLVTHPQPRSLTGETVGDASEFMATHPSLRGLSHVSGTIALLEVKGLRFEDIPFEFPAKH